MADTYTLGQEVNIRAKRFTNLGMIVTVENEDEGLIFKSDLFKSLSVGDTTVGYIKNIREDGKIDISLEKIGYKNFIDPLAERILAKLKENNGFLPLSDSSTPAEIQSMFQISKSKFKKVIGNLYKSKQISISEDSIRLVAKEGLEK